MDTQKHTFNIYSLSTVLLLLVGWGGFIYVFLFSLPFVWSRWGFFLFGIMGLTGLALPIVYFFHKKFPETPPAEPNVIIRQAMWVGVYGGTLAWLQLGRLVTMNFILGLAGGFVAAEYFIRLREKANRRLPIISDDNTS